MAKKINEKREACLGNGGDDVVIESLSLSCVLRLRSVITTKQVDIKHLQCRFAASSNFELVGTPPHDDYSLKTCLPECQSLYCLNLGRNHPMSGNNPHCLLNGTRLTLCHSKEISLRHVVFTQNSATLNVGIVLFHSDSSVRE